MSGISQLSAGPSLASFRSIGSGFKAPEAGKLPGQETAESALKALSQNPVLRSLLGESAFDSVSGKGKAEKAGASEKANPQEALQKILDTLQQLVSVLKSLAGQKAGEGAEGAQQAGGAEGAQKPGGAEGAQQAGGAEGAQQAGGAEGAGAAEEEDAKDPLQMLLKQLQKMIETLSKLLQSLQGQAQGNGNTGIVPAGATDGAAKAA